MQVPEVRYASAGGVAIAYQVWGDGPVELVSAGGPASHLDVNWEFAPLRRVYARLERFARVLVFDRRGTGLSDPVPDPPTLEQHMEDLDAVVRAAGLRRPALLGSSEAGRMCLLYAATFPERLSALVLHGVSPGPGHYTPDLQARLLRAIERWGHGDLLDVFAPSTVGDPELRRAYGRVERLAVGPGTARRLVAMGAQSDVRPVLGAVRVPTLVLHRRDDALVPLALAEELAQALPQARLVVLEGVDNALWAGASFPAAADEIEEFLTGRRATHDHDRVLATVLFTDLCGSTAHAATTGDAGWTELLRRHHTLVRQALHAHRGREVKTVGDGFVATFDGPARAVRCAHDVVAAVRAEVGLDVRAGVHTGEVELVDEDIAGLAVHIAARVSALAGAGEVLVSRTVRDLVVGSGLEFEDRGEHALKGVPDRWQLLAARAGPA